MARRRFSIRKMLQTLLTLVALSGCIVALLSAGDRQAVRHISGVKLVVEHPAGVHFLDEQLVREMLFSRRHIDPRKLVLAGLDAHAMESILTSNPWVQSAQVYVDAQRVLHVQVRQRVPVARIFEVDGNSYYIDAALSPMPISAHYTHYAPVVTGVPRLGSDSATHALRGEIEGLVKAIGRDSFWRFQVSQIDMRADGDFELVPVLGKQRIILGDTSRIQEKLSALLAFYRQVQKKVGWNRYTTLDLRFKGQVVASPKLAWHVPVDHALSNINWLQAIMENAPKNDLPGGDGAAHFDSLDVAGSPTRTKQSSTRNTPVKQKTTAQHAATNR